MVTDASTLKLTCPKCGGDTVYVEAFVPRHKTPARDQFRFECVDCKYRTSPQEGRWV